MSENRLKISNPERVARILRRICEASLPVMVRTVGTSGVAIKGRATHVIMDPGAAPGIRISNISDKGMALLEADGTVQVEFVMMATKVIFVSAVLQQEQSSILVGLPTSLISVERRKNARYVCKDEMMAYLDLSMWRPGDDDLTAPPFYPHHRRLASYINVADLSFGGLCAMARFPAVCNVLKRGIIDDNAKLVLPMQEPLSVGIEIRWFKRIKEHTQGEGGDTTFTRTFRFGISFTRQSEQVRVSIRQFIQQLAQADAI